MRKYAKNDILNPDAPYSSPSPSDSIYQRRIANGIAIANRAEGRKNEADIMRLLGCIWITIIGGAFLFKPEMVRTTPVPGLLVFLMLVIGALIVNMMAPAYKRKQQATIDALTTPPAAKARTKVPN